MSGILTGKVALVTGAARGIGGAIAEELAAAGAIVAAADIAEATTIHEGITGYRLDVGDEDSVRSITNAVVERHGGLDILVNAAGLFLSSPLLDVTREDWRRILEVNVIGLSAMIQAAAPAMIARGGGRIVNLASTGGRKADPKLLAYCASKAAVISITQATALEFAGQGIRVNAIAPGPVLTDMWREIDRDFSSRYLNQPEGSFTALASAATPDGRLAEPRDIAALALFLCSPGADHMTGQTLNIDGGNLFG